MTKDELFNLKLTIAKLEDSVRLLKTFLPVEDVTPVSVAATPAVVEPPKRFYVPDKGYDTEWRTHPDDADLSVRVSTQLFLEKFGHSKPLAIKYVMEHDTEAHYFEAQPDFEEHYVDLFRNVIVNRIYQVQLVCPKGQEKRRNTHIITAIQLKNPGAA